MSFRIVDGELIDYTGDDTEVVIPAGVTSIGKSAFCDCKGLTRITIPDSVTNIGEHAFEGCMGLTKITIPDSVTSIGESAFLYCEGLTSVVIGNGVTRIGDNAFCACENLTSVTIGNSVKKIGASAFGECPGLKSIIIPDSVVALDYDDYAGGTFCYCTNLTHVSIGKGLKKIGDCAFADCESLQEIVFHGNVTAIPKNAFEACPKFKVVIDKDLIRSDSGLSAKYVDFDFDFDDTDLVYISLFSSGKKWQTWLQDRITDADAIFSEMLSVLESNPGLVKKAQKSLTWFIETYFSNINANNIKRMKKLDGDFIGKIASETTKKQEEHDSLSEFEKPFIGMLSDVEISSEVQKEIKKGIRFSENQMICSPIILQYIVNSYYMEYKRCASLQHGEYGDYLALKDGRKLQRIESADKLAEKLDYTELVDYLTKKANSPRYRLYIVAWARYADDKSVKGITWNYKSELRGKKKQNIRAETVKESLLLSNTIAAAELFDSIGELDRYAAKRGVNEMELRNTDMIPEFGFDSDGVKRYDIGGNVIEARITDALKIELFDTNAQKVIRSFPKKSADPAKAEAAAKDFAAFKKDVTAFIKEYDLQTAKMYMIGDSISLDTWNKVYRDHPIISKLNNMIIWQDTAGCTFAVIDGQIIDSNGNDFMPNDQVRVAHVLDMDADDIVRWQKLLKDKKQSLLLEQVWEPVRQSKNTVDSSRYSGAVITSKERNLLKTRLKRRGINVSAGEVRREYDYRAGKYIFDSENDMFFDNAAKLHYTVEEKSGDLTLGDFTVRNSKDVRKINAILLELDRITISAQIRCDNVEAIEEAQLDELTVSQISDFIKLATENKATNCTALLLDYKNRKYPEYDSFDEFVLEW